MEMLEKAILLVSEYCTIVLPLESKAVIDWSFRLPPHKNPEHVEIRFKSVSFNM
jgi:hypothetical protein